MQQKTERAQTRPHRAENPGGVRSLTGAPVLRRRTYKLRVKYRMGRGVVVFPRTGIEEGTASLSGEWGTNCCARSYWSPAARANMSIGLPTVGPSSGKAWPTLTSSLGSTRLWAASNGRHCARRSRWSRGVGGWGVSRMVNTARSPLRHWSDHYVPYQS